MSLLEKSVTRIFKNSNERVGLIAASAQNYGPKIYSINESEAVLEHLIPSPMPPVGSKTFYASLGSFLHKMHKGPPFPETTPILQQIQKFMSVVKEKPALLEEMFFHMRPALEKNQTFAPCHRDLSGSNLLFSKHAFYADGFETCGMDDPFFDVATLANRFCTESAQEREFLKAYLGRRATEKEEDKLFLMRLAVLIFYGLGILHQFPEESTNPTGPLFNLVLANYASPHFKKAVKNCSI